MSERDYVGKTLVYKDPDTGQRSEGVITSVGPMPYLWVEDAGGIPEQYWIEIRDE